MYLKTPPLALSKNQLLILHNTENYDNFAYSFLNSMIYSRSTASKMINDKFMVKSIDEMIGESEVFTSINAIAAEFFLNSKKLIVFCKPFRSRRSTGFNLSS